MSPARKARSSRCGPMTLAPCAISRLRSSTSRALNAAVTSASRLQRAHHRPDDRPAAAGGGGWLTGVVAIILILMLAVVGILSCIIAGQRGVDAGGTGLGGVQEGGAVAHDRHGQAGELVIPITERVGAFVALRMRRNRAARCASTF